MTLNERLDRCKCKDESFQEEGFKEELLGVLERNLEKIKQEHELLLKDELDSGIRRMK